MKRMMMTIICSLFKLKLYSRGSQTVGRVPWGVAVGPLGGRVYCMRDTLILKEIWAQGKIYSLMGTLIG
jgi:hypothetical protein